MNIKGIPINENASHMSYYYVDVMIGENPNLSKQALIIDTGSIITCFPWKESCTYWGNHMHPPFDISQSNSAKILLWDGKKWEFQQSYDEGSAYQGFWVNDYFNILSEFHNNSSKFIFGCVSKETNLLYSQVANGVLGLGRSLNEDFKPIYYNLHQEGLISSLMFSLWFPQDNEKLNNEGKLVLGGYDANMITDPTKEVLWIQLESKDTYLFKIKAFKIGTRPLPEFSSNINIDSGTTMTYMTK